MLDNSGNVAAEFSLSGGKITINGEPISLGGDVGSWTDFTPVVTLVGGAGNTVPVYSTNQGRYMVVGKKVFYEIYLNGDGGAEGAGTGQFTVSLALAIGANQLQGPIPVGFGRDGTFPGSGNFSILGALVASTSVVSLYLFSAATATAVMTGADQTTVNRGVRLSFSCEID